VLVPESKIQFFNDEPKTTYIVSLKFRPFNKSQDGSTIPENLSQVITTCKVYGDFKRLHEFIRCSQLNRDDGKPEILPLLPSKLDQSGLKK
jgi:hypothetical protein